MVFIISTPRQTPFSGNLILKFDTSTLSSDTGMEKILEVDRSLFVDKKTINPKLLMEEGNRIWKAYKFSEVYTLPKIKQLSDYRYVDINEYKNKV